MFERRQDEATLVVFDDLNRAIEDGVDLDIVKEDLVEAINAGNITAEQYDKLNIDWKTLGILIYKLYRIQVTKI